MELGLSLGDTSRKFGCSNSSGNEKNHSNKIMKKKCLGFCMALGVGFNGRDEEDEEEETEKEEKSDENKRRVSSSSVDPSPVQLDLLPLVPVPRNRPGFPWSSENGIIHRNHPNYLINSFNFLKIK